MLHHGVIEKFVVRVNPAAFGFMMVIVLVKTSNGMTKDDVMQRVKQLGRSCLPCTSYGKNMCGGPNHQKTIR